MAPPSRSASSCCPEADRGRAAAGMEAALLKAPTPSSRLGVAAAVTGEPCPLVSSTPWLPCLANGVGSCCKDPLGE